MLQQHTRQSCSMQPAGKSQHVVSHLHRLMSRRGMVHFIHTLSLWIAIGAIVENIQRLLYNMQQCADETSDLTGWNSWLSSSEMNGVSKHSIYSIICRGGERATHDSPRLSQYQSQIWYIPPVSVNRLHFDLSPWLVTGWMLIFSDKIPTFPITTLKKNKQKKQSVHVLYSWHSILVSVVSVYVCLGDLYSHLYKNQSKF